MDESVIYSFTIMALCLGEKGMFERAFKYEDLAHNLCEKYPNTFGATRGYNGVVWCNMHSREHPAKIIDYCKKGIQCGRNSGDLYNAGLCYGPLMWNQQVQGDDFNKLEASARECLEFSRKYNLNFSVHLAEAMQAGWIEPMKTGLRARPDGGEAESLGERQPRGLRGKLLRPPGTGCITTSGNTSRPSGIFRRSNDI